jgi:hypothetical protein
MCYTARGDSTKNLYLCQIDIWLTRNASVMRQGHQFSGKSSSEPRLRRKSPTRFGDIALSCNSHQAYRDVPQCGHHMQQILLPDLRVIFSKRHISHPGLADFDLPMPSHELIKVCG